MALSRKRNQVEGGPPRRSPRNHTSSFKPPRNRQRVLLDHPPSPTNQAPLTRENLVAFNEMEKDTRSSGPRTSTKSISMTSAKFDEQAQRNGILDEHSSLSPINMVEIQALLDQRRLTASPTESMFRAYKHALARASNGEGVKMSTLQLLQATSGDTEFCTTWNQSLSSFPPDVGFNDDLSSAQPDFMQGIEATRFPSKIIEELGGSAKPYPNRYAATLSHFAGEWKGPGKDLTKAQGQAAYDGACMVYGRDKALRLIGKPDVIGYASVHTFTCDGTTLNTFAHHAVETSDRCEYHQKAASRTILINSLDEFKAGWRRMRNLQDLTQENSQALREQLVSYAAVVEETKSQQRSTFLSPDSITQNDSKDENANTEFIEKVTDALSLTLHRTRILGAQPKPKLTAGTSPRPKRKRER